MREEIRSGLNVRRATALLALPDPPYPRFGVHSHSVAAHDIMATGLCLVVARNFVCGTEDRRLKRGGERTMVCMARYFI